MVAERHLIAIFIFVDVLIVWVLHGQISDFMKVPNKLQQPATSVNGELPIRPYILETRDGETQPTSGTGRSIVNDVPRRAADRNYKLRIAEMTEEELSSGTQCKSHEDLFPGTIVTNGAYPYYKPDNCIMKVYSAREMSICIDKERYLNLGDSILRGMTDEIHVPDKKRAVEGNWYRSILSPDKSKGMETYGTASYNKKRSKATSHFFKSAAIDKSISEATIISLNAGAWDMGRSFDGFWEFFVRVKLRLQYIKKNKSPHARVLLFSPHWIHFDRCEGLCSRCNTPEKTRVFREAVELAASCEKVEYYDTSKITQNESDASKISIDGIHFTREYADIESDVFFNAVCRDPPLKAKEPIPCNESAAFKRWSAVPEASLGCDNMTLNQVRDLRSKKGGKVNYNYHYVKKKRTSNSRPAHELNWLRAYQETLEMALFATSFVTVIIVLFIVEYYYGISPTVPGSLSPMAETSISTGSDIENGPLFQAIRFLRIKK
eukprot:TRINITY_DN24630_c0_g1_i1.p1 TRINITY_DN24630_c0_g1~~TRINITY_DN24630_c0_g1_i1.p1  ORF type:complete len:492 (+),score=81.73 TRINITY_DN24630_c0_g1_i1:97-1572(+)